MNLILRPDLSDVNTLEVREFLDGALPGGLYGVGWKPSVGLYIETDKPEAEVNAALASFVPQTRGRPNETLLPPFVRDHIQHLRDYRTLVRGGGSPTDAQTAHVVADLIDALRLVNSRITGD